MDLLTWASERTARECSKAARESMVGKAAEQRMRVLEAIRRSAHGATSDELEQLLELPHQSCSARVHELMKAGAIVAVGKRDTRSGRKATVWSAL